MQFGFAIICIVYLHMIKDIALQRELIAKALITDSELEIIQYMADGLSSAAIAKKRGTSTKTIEVHRHNIFKKTGCKNAPHLIAAFFRKGLIK